MMSSNLMHGREGSAAAPIGSLHETPVNYLHLKESSSIPSLLRGADSFTITRLESSAGSAEPNQRRSRAFRRCSWRYRSQSLARADYQFWVDEKRVPTPYIPAFRSTVIDLYARPSCWVRRAFDYVLFHVPRKVLDDIAADLCRRPGGELQGLGGGRRPRADTTDEERSSLRRATRLAFSVRNWTISI